MISSIPVVAFCFGKVAAKKETALYEKMLYDTKKFTIPYFVLVMQAYQGLTINSGSFNVGDWGSSGTCNID